MNALNTLKALHHAVCAVLPPAAWHQRLVGTVGTLALLLGLPAWGAVPFTVNTDGTVTDSSTQLVWDQCPYPMTGSSCATGTAFNGTWASALAQATAANTASYKGFTDWRVPNKNELESLAKLDSYTAGQPAIDTAAFPGTPSSLFWTSTSYAPNPAQAWVVNFDYGGTYAYTTSNTSYVRLVRSGQPVASFDLLGTPPVLSALGVSATTDTATTLSATSSAAGAGYWLVVPSGATAPTAAQVKAGVSYGAVTVTVTAAGSDATLVAATAKTFSVASLVQATAYDLYVVAENEEPRISLLGGPIAFTTQAIVTPSAGANGSISPNTAQTVAVGTAPVLQLMPDTGYSVASVGGTCGGSLGSGNTSFTVNSVTANCTVVVTFAINTYTITTSPSPTTGGTVSCTPNPVSHGGSTTCTAPPATGYSLTAFTGDCSGTTCNLSNVTSAKTVGATFTLNSYTITTSASPTTGGSVSCTPNPVSHGGTATCTATPATGYSLTAFTGDCSGTTCNLSNVTSAKTVGASFTALPVKSYTAPSPGGSGSITAAFTGGSSTCGYDGSQQYMEASALTATLPAAGVSFPQGLLGFTTTDCGVGAVLGFTVTYPQTFPAGTQYYKFGPEPGNTTPHWYVLPATISGNQISFSITDNGLGDSNPAVGFLTDPGGPGVLAAPVAGNPTPVPTLGEWGLLLLMGLVGLLGMGGLPQRRRV